MKRFLWCGGTMWLNFILQLGCSRCDWLLSRNAWSPSRRCLAQIWKSVRLSSRCRRLHSLAHWFSTYKSFTWSRSQSRYPIVLLSRTKSHLPPQYTIKEISRCGTHFKLSLKFFLRMLYVTLIILTLQSPISSPVLKQTHQNRKLSNLVIEKHKLHAH